MTAVIVVGALALNRSSVAAQQPITVPMQVTENRVPGAAGQVTITPLGNNQLRIQIRITGLQPNAQHAAHVHGPGQAGVCDSGAPITHPLNNVTVDASGVGTSDTTVTPTADNPVRPESYVNVHQGASPPGPGVICGDIPVAFLQSLGASGGQPAAGQGGMPAAPRTGTGIGGDHATSARLLLAAAALALGGLAVARRYRRGQEG